MIDKTTLKALIDFDRQVIANLKAAELIETPTQGGCRITLGHLFGTVGGTAEGEVVWQVHRAGGTIKVDQSDVGASSRRWNAYARQAVINNLYRLRPEVLAAAEARIARNEASLAKMEG